MTKEIRAIGNLSDFRDDDEGKIIGYAAVFNSPTVIGGSFREQIAPGAFEEAIGTDDVRALIDHDSSLVLGRNTAGTLEMIEDDKGLRVEITPPDTQVGRDIVTLIKRGDVSQMSFGFRAEEEEWDDSDDLPMRTIRKAGLFDVSVVTYPAYTDTEVAVRSFQEHCKTKEQPEKYKRSMRLRLAEQGIAS